MEYGSISINFLKKILFLFIAYALGYLQYSIIWIVIPVILDIIKEKEINEKLLRRNFIRNITFKSEKDVIGSLSQHLPAWVCFPDMEKAEWINRIIKQLWPNVNNYVHDIIKELLEEKLNKMLGKYKLSGLVFDKLVVGSVPFRVGGIVVYENVSRNEIVLDMDISYAGDCEVILKFAKLKGGIKDFQLYGRLRVLVKPLIDTLPLVGGLQVFFLNPPDIDFNLEGLAGVLEMSGLNELLKKLILDTICSVIVLPNKYPLVLSKSVSKEDIKIPNPTGILRIHVVQAKKLMKRDMTFSGHLTSDPYAIVTIGDQQYKTPVRERTTRPQWDYWCEFIIEEITGVNMYVSLWDQDTLQEDEPLGRTKVLVSKLIKRQTADMWFNLETVKHGQVQIRSTWLNLSTNHDDLKTALQEIQQLKISTLSSVILVVFIDSAMDIVPSDSQKVEPYVQVEIEKQERTTKVNKKQLNPVWEEGFTFLVGNPENNYISFKIIDQKGDKTLGIFSYNIEALFGEVDFKIEKQTFRLLQCETMGKINLSMKLKILKNASFKPRDEQPVSKSTDQLENQTEHDNFKETELWEHSSLSRSSSISSVSDDNTSSRTDVLSPAKIKLTLRYSVQRQKLIVVVHHLEDLLFDETKGLYVKLYILPERHKNTKRKTQVIRTSKNPVFDETFEFEISQEELSSKHLELSICEEKVIRNEPIQKVVIDLDKLPLALSHTRLFTLFTKSHRS